MKTRCKRIHPRGVTLVEILIVMTLISLVIGGVVAGTGQLSRARLHRAATMLTGGVRVGLARAATTSTRVRMVFDFAQQTVWLEETHQPMFVEAHGEAFGGADPATTAEKQAVAEHTRLLQGPQAPRATFQPIRELGFEDPETGQGVRPLGTGIRFLSVQTTHDDAPRTEGRAYLYLWPGGKTERASIQVRIGESTDPSDILTLLVAPLTGRVTLHNGPVEIPHPPAEQDSPDHVWREVN